VTASIAVPQSGRDAPSEHSAHRSTVSTASEVDVVETQLENLPLAEFLFEVERQQSFAKRSRDGLIASEKPVASQLRRDGAGPLIDSSAGDVGDDGAADAGGCPEVCVNSGCLSARRVVVPVEVKMCLRHFLYAV
jgi:hypothetical protein